MDFDTAYWRLYVVAHHTIRAITTLKGLNFIILFLHFGEVTGPTLYSNLSESIFDSTNGLLEDKTQEPDILYKFRYIPES